MQIQPLLEQLQSLPASEAISQSAWLFPTIESLHVLSFTFTLGTIAMVDLRLLGLSGRDQPVSRMTREILPWTWVGFVSTVIFGFLLFSSQAEKYFANGAFRYKMILIALAGVNMLIFHLFTYRGVARWDRGITPFGAKFAGAVSLALWIGVVAFGRWIGFTMFG
jgi:hypothetical protein